MFDERNTSSSEVMASVVAHVVGLLKSHVANLNLELLREDYRCESDAERNVFMDDAYDAAHHFVSSYDFSVISGQSSPGDHS
jgi:hypothetical protein